MQYGNLILSFIKTHAENSFGAFGLLVSLFVVLLRIT